MEEFESQTEHVEEELHHHAHHGERWVAGVALTAALLAGLAAVTALLSGHYANDAMLDRMVASDQWSYYQAKSIKATIVESGMAAAEAAGQPVRQQDRDTLARYEREQKEIKAEAEEKEAASRAHFRRHTTLSYGVTFSQVAIAVSAISVLVKRKAFWFVGIALGAIGVGLLVAGLLQSPAGAGGAGGSPAEPHGNPAQASLA
jgi:Flp pilus assembly protein TadB